MMEPVAPGTEDEPLYTQVSNKPSKKETAEEQALSKKAFLPNGKYGNIFELNYIQGAQHWFCKVCECPVLGRLFNHEIGKRHTANLEKWNKSIDFSSQDSSESKDKDGGDNAILIAPGEPVPPGFEEEIEKTTQIQERLDKFNVGPLVGLEYLLELLDYDPSKEPLYLCILCDKKGDPRTVLTHLSSYNHQVMYLQKHFPTVYRHIAPFMIKQYKRNWQTGLQKIAEAIENTFGRLKPMAVEANRFETDRMHYIEIVARGKHFSELSGHTFEDVVTREDLVKVHEEPKPYDSSLPFRKAQQGVLPAKRKSPSPPVVAKPVKKIRAPAAETPNKPNFGNRVTGASENVNNSNVNSKAAPKRRSLSPVSDISSSDLEDYEPKSQERTREQIARRDRSPVVKRRALSPPPPVKRREGPMPWQKSNYGRVAKSASQQQQNFDRKRDDKAEKIEEYKKLAKAIDNDMEQVLKRHKQNPEKHAKYNDEWKKFWNMRYKELQAEGKNASTHDFKPEWIEFWNKRMLELHQEEIKTKKAGLRKRLGLPDEPPPISFKIGERRKQPSEQSKPLPTAAQPDNDPEVIVIEDNDRDSERSRSPSGAAARRRRRRLPSDSPPPSSSFSKRRGGGGADRSPQYRKRSSPGATSSSKRGGDSSPPPPTFNQRRGRNHSDKTPSPPPPAVRRGGRLSKERSSAGFRDRDGGGKRAAGGSPDSPPPVRQQRSSDGLRFSPPPSRRYSMERSPGPEWYRGGRDQRSPPPPIRGRSSRESSRDRYRPRGWEPAPPSSSSSYHHHHRMGGVGGVPAPPLDYVDPYAPPKVLRDVTRAPVLDDEPSMTSSTTRPSRGAANRKSSSPPIMNEPEDDGEVNAVSVLRLLTALEEKLGSLGPRVIDLLARALAMEKKQANSSEELLDSEMNCVLFETVKEKLKGQLLAGFVDRYQERAFKIAIRKTAALIHMASERKRQRDVELPKKPVVVPGVGTVDKGKIARQIANALIAQGKTDVTQDELEQLINAVVGIAEARKNTSEPLTTASFLERIAGGASMEETPSKNSESSASKDEENDKQHQQQKQLDKKLKASDAHSDRASSCDAKEQQQRAGHAPSSQKEEEPRNRPASSSQDRIAAIDMEGLSDSDLQTLLQNFKDLSTEEQHGLINYLKKLEAKEPERVEKLRKFVNLTEENGGEEKQPNNQNADSSGRYSPFSNRLGSTNPTLRSEDEEKDDEDESEKKNKINNDKNESEGSSTKDQNKSSFINIDSEDEEYSFEDVAKAASQKVIEKEMEQKRIEEETKKDAEDKTLNDAKALITSLMSSLNKGGNNSNNSNGKTTASGDLPPQGKDASSSSGKTGEGASVGAKINIISNVPVSSVDIAKSLSGITMSMSSLDSILGNVQNLTRQNRPEQQQQQPVTTGSRPPPPENLPTIGLNFSTTPSPSATAATSVVSVSHYQQQQQQQSGSNVAQQQQQRNNYNEFDIGSQRDVRKKPEFSGPGNNYNNGGGDVGDSTTNAGRNRTNRPYDEFNIGPNPGEFREERETRGKQLQQQQQGYGMGGPQIGAGGYLHNKLGGFPERELLKQQSQQQERNNAPPFSPQVGFRGGPGAPPPHYNRGVVAAPPPLMAKMPPSNNFDAMTRGGASQEFHRDEFRGPPSSSNVYGGAKDNHHRPGGLGADFRGGNHNEFRGGMGGNPGDFRGGKVDNAGDFRGRDVAEFRGGSAGDFRGGNPGDFRGGAGDFRGGKAGEFRGGFRDDGRGAPPNRGGGGASMNKEGGLHSSGPNRFSGGNNNNNSYRRW